MSQSSYVLLRTENKENSKDGAKSQLADLAKAKCSKRANGAVVPADLAA